MEGISLVFRDVNMNASALAEPAVTARTDSATWDVFSQAVVEATRRLIAQAPSARLGEPQGVHQARSAGRRLRGLLWTFRPLLNQDWADRLDQDLSRFVHALGASRDLDVLSERLIDSAADLAADLQPLFDDLLAQRAAARVALEEALEDGPFESLIDFLTEAARTPHLADLSQADESVEDIGLLSRLAHRAWKTLAKRGRALDESTADEEFHEVRKRAKRARYAVEAIVSGLSGRSARRALRFARRLAAVQDVLGEHQDAVVSREWISTVAAAHPHNPRFQLAAGRLIERRHQVALSSRAAFFQAWKRLDQPKLRRWGS
ncbi:MAG: CHAD domain-containing protein [Isosphaeraceae bacterium]